MLPELHSFCAFEEQSLEPFEAAHQAFWNSLKGEGAKTAYFWLDVQERVVSATPDTEDFMSRQASYALNVAMIIYEITGFLIDENDEHISSVIGYAQDSLDAYASTEVEATFYNDAVEAYIKAHPLLKKEIRTEIDDAGFLAALSAAPWPADIMSILQSRAKEQTHLFGVTS